MDVERWGGGRNGVEAEEEEGGAKTGGTAVGATAVVPAEKWECEEEQDRAATLDEVLLTEVLRMAGEEEIVEVSFLLPAVPPSAPRPGEPAKDKADGEEEEGPLVLLLPLLGCGIEGWLRVVRKRMCAREGRTQ